MAETSLHAVTKGRQTRVNRRLRRQFVQMSTDSCRMKGSGYCPRPLEKTTFLSRKWTLSIIVTIGNFGSLRFNDLLRRIDGITQKTLSERLQELERYKLVSRQSFAEKPPRVEYSLTHNGQKVRKAVLPLIKLAESSF